MILWISFSVSVVFIGQSLKLLNLDDIEVLKIPKIKCVISTSKKKVEGGKIAAFF